MQVMFLGFKNNLVFLLFALLTYSLVARDGGLALVALFLMTAFAFAK
ncbi:MAG: hypothetical protein QXR53_04525 [Candidatus Norongarragalinales archaeon]